MPTTPGTFNADLIDDLARQRVALFLGSGVSASAKTRRGTRIRQWGPFLSDTAKRLRAGPLKNAVRKAIRDGDFLVACELIKLGLGDSWKSTINDEYQTVGEPSALHRAILGLKQRVYVTTNFDKLIESALDSVDQSSTHHPMVIVGPDKDAFRLFRDNQGRYVVKLHGTIDHPETLIFSKSDYASRAFANAAYSEFLRTLLLSYTVVFIGFSMTDPAIALSMEMNANFFPAVRPHYIFSGGEMIDEVVGINKQLKNLFVISYDPSNGHKKLPFVLRKLAQKVDERRRELRANL